DLQATIRAECCGRNFYVHGVRNHTITVLSKNQLGASKIATSSNASNIPQDCENITVYYTDRDSDGGPLSGHEPSVLPFTNPILLSWHVAAKLKAIRIHLDIKNISNEPFGEALFFELAEDAPPLGHVLDGFCLSGVVEQNVGTFAFSKTWSPGVVKVNDFRIQ